MPRQKFTNLGISKLAGSLTNSATSLTVTASEGAKFPTITGSDWFMCNLVKLVSNLPVQEIVKVTARSSDTFTIVRAQEGSAATTFSAGDLVELRVTAGSMDNLPQLVADNTYTGINDFTGGSINVPTAAKGDNDNSAASTAHVKANGITFGDESSATGTATLTSAVAGNIVVGASASAHTQTMPLANTVRKGDIIWFFNSGAGAMTIQRQGSDIFDGAGGNSIVLPQYGSAAFDSNNVGTWRLVGGTAHERYFASQTLVNVLMDSPTSQTVPNNSSTLVTNWTSRQNVGNAFNATTGVFTAPRPGKYLFNTSILFGSTSFSAAGQEATAVLHKNGSQERALRFVVSAAATIQPSTPTFSYVITLAAGDTLDIRAYQNGGASSSTATNVNTFLSITELY